MATHSSVLAWRISGTEEPGGLPSLGSHRVGHDWCDLAAAAAAVHSLGKIQLASALLHFVLQGQTCLLLQVSLDFPLLHSNPQWWVKHLFLVLVLGGLLGFLINFSFFGIGGRDIDLNYCNVELLALEVNRDHSVVFEILSKYCISDSFWLWWPLPSSKGFLRTVVDIMVKWVKFTHSSAF